MKRIITLFISFLSLASFAQDICKEVKNENIEFKYFNNHLFSISQSTLSKFDQNYNLIKQIELEGKIVDLQFIDGQFYILHTNKISIYDQEFSLEDEIVLKLNNSSVHDLPTSLAISQEKIYVGHGEHQLLVINKNDLTQEKYQYPLPHAKSQRSKVTGLVIHESNLIMLLDNITYDFSTNKRAFEGVLVIALNDLKSAKPISIRQEVEAHHEGSLFISGGKLYSQHLHIVFELDIKKLLTGKYFYPQRRLFNFDGKNIYGRATVINKNIVGCFRKYEPQTDSFILSFDSFKI